MERDKERKEKKEVMEQMELERERMEEELAREKAKEIDRYAETSQSLRRLSADNDTLQAQVNELQQQIQEKKTDSESLMAVKEELESQLRAQGVELMLIRSNADKAKEEVQSMEAQVASLEESHQQEMALKESRIDKLSRQLNDSTEQLALTAKEIQDLKCTMQEHTPRKNSEARLDCLHREISRLSTALQGLEQKNAEAEAQVIEMRAAVTQHQCISKELENAKCHLQSLRDQELRHEKLACKLENMERLRKTGLEEMETLRLALEMSTSALDSSNNKCRELEHQLTSLQERLIGTDDQRRTVQARLDSSAQELIVLRSAASSAITSGMEILTQKMKDLSTPHKEEALNIIPSDKPFCSTSAPSPKQRQNLYENKTEDAYGDADASFDGFQIAQATCDFVGKDSVMKAERQDVLNCRSMRLSTVGEDTLSACCSPEFKDNALRNDLSPLAKPQIHFSPDPVCKKGGGGRSPMSPLAIRCANILKSSADDLKKENVSETWRISEVPVSFRSSSSASVSARISALASSRSSKKSHQASIPGSDRAQSMLSFMFLLIGTHNR